MELREALEARASCRKFRAEPVPVEDLREMVRAAGLAPSPGNTQPWRFVAVLGAEAIEPLGRAVRQRLAAALPDPADERAARARARAEWLATFFTEAPAVIAVVHQPRRTAFDDLLEGQRDERAAAFREIDRAQPALQAIGAAIENLLLAATAMRYGACWLTAPLVARAQLEDLLDIREPERLVALVAVGRPAALDAEHRARRPLDEIFTVRY
ncbi:MAG: nitroreductase family protein [Acidobacteriota bacterium]